MVSAAANKIIFMGTPDYAVPTLNMLLAESFPIAAVYCQPPRPAGRGKKTRPSPVQRRSEKAGLKVCMPPSLKGNAEQHEFAAFRADLCVVVAYGLILPKAVVELPRLGCINAHASLLPRWRGAAPIQRAIMAGDTETGVCIMQMDEGLDTGPVLCRERLSIDAQCDGAEMHDQLAKLSAILLAKTANQLFRGTAPEPVAQSGEVSYAAKIEKAETRLDWNRPANELANLVRALSPSPGVWFLNGEDRIKLLAAQATGSMNVPPGTVLAGDGLTVACGGDTALRLTRLQRPGKGAMAGAEFLRGYAISPGKMLACPATS